MLNFGGRQRSYVRSANGRELAFKTKIWRRMAEPFTGAEGTDGEVSDWVKRALRYTRRAMQVNPERQHRFNTLATGAMQEAVRGISTIRRKVAQIRDVTEQAQATSDPARRRNLADDYHRLRNEIDAVAMGAEYKGVNLLCGHKRALVIEIHIDTRSKFAICQTNVTAGRRGLYLPALAGAFADEDEIAQVLQAVDIAQAHLEYALKIYREQATVIANKIARMSSSAGA